MTDYYSHLAWCCLQIIFCPPGAQILVSRLPRNYGPGNWPEVHVGRPDRSSKNNEQAVLPQKLHYLSAVSTRISVGISDEMHDINELHEGRKTCFPRRIKGL
jgi:hypothetical protein